MIIQQEKRKTYYEKSYWKYSKPGKAKKKKANLSQTKMDFSDLSDTFFLTFIPKSNRQTKQGIVYCFGEECIV